MKRITLFLVILCVVAYGVAYSAPLSKVSPLQGSTSLNPLSASSGSRTVIIKADGVAGTSITAASNNSGIISVSPSATTTGADSTASFSVSYVPGITVANATLTFASGPDTLLVYARRTDGSRVPSLTTYGLIVLALLLAGTAVWMFRRRRVSVA